MTRGGAEMRGGGDRGWLVPLSIAVVGAVITLPLLGSTGLWDPCESLAAEVAREAAREGAWLPLRFDGEALPAVPPLFFWLQALVMTVAGTTEWAVRLPLACLSVGWLVLVWWQGRRLLGPRPGMLIPLALATSGFFYLGARHTSPDLFAAMILTSACLQVALLMASDRQPSRRDGLLAHGLLAALPMAGGLLPLACLAGAVGLGPLLGNIPARSIRRLVPRGASWIPWGIVAIWIGAGAVASGPAALAGMWTTHPLAHGILFGFEPVESPSFTWQLHQLGHMAYPWFIAAPAALVWLVPRSQVVEEADPEPEAGRRSVLHLVVSLIALVLFSTSLSADYLPLDCLPAAPLVVLLAAWGLSRAVELEKDPTMALAITIGGVLVILGSGSQGVDFFWYPKRILETGGYMFDRVYPDLGKVAQGFHTGLAILVGVAAAPATFVRRRTSLVPVVLLAAAFAVAGFEVVHVFQKVEIYLSVGPLHDAWKAEAREGDRLVAVELDPQIRGGHVFYFEREMTDEGGLEALPDLMDEVAGRSRLVIVSSHVRALYNEVHALSCGRRIDALNEERRWYSISTYEGPPHMPSYRIVVPGGRAGARIARPVETPLWHGRMNRITFLGWSASCAGADGTTPAEPGRPVAAERGGWVELDLYWRAEQRMNEAWRVLLDATLRGAGDAGHLKGHHRPACGRHPTHAWEPGDVIRDRYYLWIPPDAPTGTYMLRTGIYREGDRMVVRQSGGSGARETSTLNLGSLVVR